MTEKRTYEAVYKPKEQSREREREKVLTSESVYKTGEQSPKLILETCEDYIKEDLLACGMDSEIVAARLEKSDGSRQVRFTVKVWPYDDPGLDTTLDEFEDCGFERAEEWSRV